MSKHTKETGPEFLLIETWKGWDGDGLDWMYFYDCKLQPGILADCVAKGYSPDQQFDVDLCMNAMEASVITTNDNGEEITVMKYKLRLSIFDKE